uniref:pyrroline-5-carboxylate reductase n=1 Tax=uncultured Ruthenibacterium sp. TaxID=1905347 RepID=UPI00349E5178
GFGNMAGAIAKGLIRQQAVRPEQLCACAKNWDKLCANTQKLGMRAYQNASEVVFASDVVFVAVKPYLVREVLEPVRDLLAGKIVISVAAGCPFDWYEAFLSPGTHHMSTIPNTPVCIGEGVFVCEKKHSLTQAEWTLVEQMLSKISLVCLVETNQLSVAGTVSGCGPAFASMFLEALGDAGVKHGLPRKLAYELAAQMIAGTGKLMLETGDHPGVMKDAVCSPGGTTIVGVATLERKGFRSAVIDAVDAIENR